MKERREDEISKVVQSIINLYTQYNDVNSLYMKVTLTPDSVELLPLNKVSMGFTAASTSTPMMVTVTPPLHIGERQENNNYSEFTDRQQTYLHRKSVNIRLSDYEIINLM